MEGRWLKPSSMRGHEQCGMDVRVPDPTACTLWMQVLPVRLRTVPEAPGRGNSAVTLQASSTTIQTAGQDIGCQRKAHGCRRSGTLVLVTCCQLY